MRQIHPTAIIHPQADLADDVIVGPYCIIESNARLHAGVRLENHVVIKSHTTLFEKVHVHSFSVIGGSAQMMPPVAESLGNIEVHENTIIREHVTINAATKANFKTVIGRNCFLMAASHVGHDCELKDQVILANSVLLGGFVSVGSHTFLGGSAVVHQFTVIGESCMIGGNATITQDVPPFLTVTDRNQLSSLNLIGMRRRGFGRKIIQELKFCFQAVYNNSENISARENAFKLLNALAATTPQANTFLRFFERETKKGFVSFNQFN
jgi:UDP-N-acetylglucosamine acyltransferase